MGSGVLFLLLWAFAGGSAAAQAELTDGPQTAVATECNRPAQDQRTHRSGDSVSQDRDDLDLGEFELPLEYGPGEEEGQGWLCPSIEAAPFQRAMFIVRQEMIGRAEPRGQTMPVEFLFPAPRNLGEQRRLASRIRVHFSTLDEDVGEDRLLDYTAELIYSQPYNNPFLRVRFSSPRGEVKVQVDSWISNLRPAAGKLENYAEYFRRMNVGLDAVNAFCSRYKVKPVSHWAEPKEGQPRGADLVSANGNSPFELVYDVLSQTAKLVPYEPGKHMTDPFQVLDSEGGDAESRATVVWYALQDEMRVCQVSGYNRQFVDTEFAGFDAWNALVLDGYTVADVGDSFNYLGHDHAQYIATSIGTDHVLEDYPQLKRHLSYSAGLYSFNDGELTMRQFASLTATSGLAFGLPNGRHTFPKTDATLGRGEGSRELDADLRKPPPGIVQLVKEVLQQRRDVNDRD